MSTDYEGIKIKIRDKVKEKLSYDLDMRDEEIKDLIDEEVVNIGRFGYLSLAQKSQLSIELFHNIRKLDVLEEFINDTGVTEIMVNGANQIFIERNGTLFLSEKQFESREKLEDIIQQIVGKVNRVVNESSPIVDGRLENGARVHIVLPPIALNGPILTIRRFPDKPITMDDLLAFGSITKEAVDFLKTLVVSKYNILISGGTGSGKTTFLNVLSNYIPEEERVITIEDSAELQIHKIPNLVRLETRNANVVGCKEITIRDLIKASLRMRPDRVVVGEVRGGEAIDMLQAFSTGHDGSLSTAHANSAKDMITRLETMVLMGVEMPLQAIKRHIASSIDIIVHLGRIRDHSRKVLEIAEVVGFENGEVKIEPIFSFVNHKQLEKVGDLIHRDKLEAADEHRLQ